MKRVSALFLALALILSLSPALAAEPAPAFSDVPADAWYAPYIQTCVDAGLLAGKGKGRFDPDGTVTIGELTVCLGRLLNYNLNGTAQLPEMPGWYPTNAKIDGVPIGEYALPDWVLRGFYGAASLGKGHINTDNVYRRRTIVESWSATADRFALAEALYFAFYLGNNWDDFFHSDQHLYVPLNDVAYLPDTGLYAALEMVRAGVLTGKDAYGTFDGYGTLTRAELAVALTRLIDPAQRVSLALTPWPGWDSFTLTPIPLPEGCRYYWLWENGVSSNSNSYLLDGQFLHIEGYPADAAVEDQRSGLLDKYGNWVVKPDKFEDIWSFELDGYADGWLADPTGAQDCCGREFIDAKGNTVPVKPVKAGPYPFYDEDAQLAGYKNADGSILVPPTYKYGYGFSEGLAPVCDENWNWGFIDETGAPVIPLCFQYDLEQENISCNDISSNFLAFQDGNAVMPEQPASAEDTLTRYGTIDRRGNWVLPAIYNSLAAPSEGKMAFAREDLVGYVSLTDGTELLLHSDFLYGDSIFLSQSLCPFSEGKAAVRYEAMCYIDDQGNPLTPPLFDQAGPVVNGEAIVLLDGTPYRIAFNK